MLIQSGTRLNTSHQMDQGKLLTPTHFSWAKDLLTSKAWHTFQQQSPAVGLPFLLPGTCPRKEAPSCSYLHEIIDSSEDEGEQQEIGTDMGTPQMSASMVQDTSESTSALHRQRKR